MKENINSVLKNCLLKVTPSEEETKKINAIIKDFLEKAKKQIKTLRIGAECFLGGSFAKNTAIKKDHYDIDIFVRFEKRHAGGDISKFTAKILKKMRKKAIKIHGSRDYFRIVVERNIFIEIIPVMDVKKPEDAENVTDLSYSHVKYIIKKIKKIKISDEIRLAKAFCYANKCYGAESYINGFSGYALELLIVYYGSFLKFIREMAKAGANKEGRKKIIIDIEKKYKNQNEILMDINASKLQSPIVIVDPTFKKRNAAAALSKETFERFAGACRDFLKNPREEAFEIKRTDIEKIREGAKKNGSEFILIETKTDRQEGDIAGSKLLKFYRHLEDEISRWFEVKNKGFNYNQKRAARFYFVVKRKKDILINGPSINQKEHAAAFKKEHPDYFIKEGRIYSQASMELDIKKFVKKWKDKNHGKIKDMSITGLEIIAL